MVSTTMEKFRVQWEHMIWACNLNGGGTGKGFLEEVIFKFKKLEFT